MKIVVKGMEKDSSLMDYNFIIINALTNKGFYLYPPGSYGIFSLSKQLSRAWKKIAIDEARTQYTLLDRESRKGGFKSYFSIKYPKELKAMPLVREGDFEELVKELTELKSMSLEFSQPKYVSRLFSGSRKFLKSHKIFVSFKPVEQNEIEYLASSVLAAVKAGRPKKATVHGTEDGSAQTIKLENNLKAFETFTYDDIANKIIELDLAEFEKCIIFSEMKKRASKEPLITRPNMP